MCVSSDPSAGENLRSLVYRRLFSYRTRGRMLMRQTERKSSMCPSHAPAARALPLRKKLGRADTQRQEKWGHQGTCLPSHILSLTQTSSQFPTGHNSKSNTVTSPSFNYVHCTDGLLTFLLFIYSFNYFLNSSPLITLSPGAYQFTCCCILSIKQRAYKL